MPHPKTRRRVNILLDIIAYTNTTKTFRLYWTAKKSTHHLNPQPVKSMQENINHSVAQQEDISVALVVAAVICRVPSRTPICCTPSDSRLAVLLYSRKTCWTLFCTPHLLLELGKVGTPPPSSLSHTPNHLLYSVGFFLPRQTYYYFCCVPHTQQSYCSSFSTLAAMAG